MIETHPSTYISHTQDIHGKITQVPELEEPKFINKTNLHLTQQTRSVILLPLEIRRNSINQSIIQSINQSIDGRKEAKDATPSRLLCLLTVHSYLSIFLTSRWTNKGNYDQLFFSHPHHLIISSPHLYAILSLCLTRLLLSLSLHICLFLFCTVSSI